MARRSCVAALAAISLAGIAACSSATTSSESASSLKASAATSAAGLGGMAALADAAKKEGTLNVIALPPDRVSYHAVIRGFQAKYGLEVVDAQPDGTSADQISAAKSLRGRPSAPDVFDLVSPGPAPGTTLFAPYKVAMFSDIPATLKSPDGLEVSDYGGYLSIGYDASKVPAPKTLADLLKPAYRGKVVLSGDPAQTGAGLSAVVAAALSQGGTPNDISKGLDFFRALKKAGGLLRVDPTGATTESTRAPVILDWDYLNVARGKKVTGRKSWHTVIPAGAVVGAYNTQAINRYAPHPAAARLWEEYLYSDEGQNLWLKGGGRPVRERAMTASGTLDRAASAALPKATGKPVILTRSQSVRANAYLSTSWAKAIG